MSWCRYWLWIWQLSFFKKKNFKKSASLNNRQLALSFSSLSLSSHWKQLIRNLRVHWVLNDLTLGQVWDADLQKNEAIFREVIMVAQGEMALEEFLKQVREQWQSYQLDRMTGPIANPSLSV